MRLATYRPTAEEGGRLGAIFGDTIVDLERFGAAKGVTISHRMIDFIGLYPSGTSMIGKLLSKYHGVFPLASTVPLVTVRLKAPNPRPRKNIFRIGLNYLDRSAAAAQALETSPELPRQPVILSKPPTLVIGDGDPVLHDRAITQQLDWEVERGVVSGTTARPFSPESALSHVLGYSVLVYIGARDCRRAGRWIYSRGKDSNSNAPMGLMIVTADEIGNPQRVDLWLTVNGVESNAPTRATCYSWWTRLFPIFHRAPPLNLRTSSRAGRRTALVPAARPRSGSGRVMSSRYMLPGSKGSKNPSSMSRAADIKTQPALSNFVGSTKVRSASN